MQLTDLLAENKDAIIEKWFDLVVETYPGLSSLFLKKKHQFGNPAGVKTRAAIDALFQELLDGELGEEAAGHVDAIVRIRAVQDFSPGQAVGVVFYVKYAVRDVLREQLGDKGLLRELLAFETRVDRLALLAFDAFAKCREQVYEMRLEDHKRRFSGLLRRTKFLSGIPGEDPGVND